jgi:hypothetical protein
MRVILGLSFALMAFVAQTNAQTDDTGTVGTASPQQTDSALPAVTTDSGGASKTDSNTPTATPTATESSSADTLPQLTSSSAGLPSLTTSQLPATTQDNSNVPTYQITIPSNADNPFLQTSSYPDGTVFIIVGSCLAGMALIVIAWRALYVWCLHRQTKQSRRDLKYTEISDQRPYSTINGGGMGMVNSNPFASQISLDYLRPGDRTSRVSTLRPSTGNRPSTSGRPVSSGNVLNTQSMQFYSPSAHPGATTAAAIATQPIQHDTGYLPAGYYLRDSTASASPRQQYSTPSPTFLADSSAPPIPRLSRTSSGNTIATMLSTRPQTAGGSLGYGGVNARPSSSREATPNQAYTQPRRTTSRDELTFAGDRRSKPSQVLDELLGGR